MVDLAVHNAYVLFLWANPTSKLIKRQFIELLAKALAINTVKRRQMEPKLSNDLSALITTFIANYESTYSHIFAACSTCMSSTAAVQCDKCKLHCCEDHQMLKKMYICDSCQILDTMNICIKPIGTVKRCSLCPRSKDRKTSIYCHNCESFICSSHKHHVVLYKICDNCS